MSQLIRGVAAGLGSLVLHALAATLALPRGVSDRFLWPGFLLPELLFGKPLPPPFPVIAFALNILFYAVLIYVLISKIVDLVQRAVKGRRDSRGTTT